jgi:hypothetical protein
MRRLEGPTLLVRHGWLLDNEMAIRAPGADDTQGSALRTDSCMIVLVDHCYVNLLVAWAGVLKGCRSKLYGRLFRVDSKVARASFVSTNTDFFFSSLAMPDFKVEEGSFQAHTLIDHVLRALVSANPSQLDCSARLSFRPLPCQSRLLE